MEAYVSLADSQVRLQKFTQANESMQNALSRAQASGISEREE